LRKLTIFIVKTIFIPKKQPWYFVFNTNIQFLERTDLKSSKSLPREIVSLISFGVGPFLVSLMMGKLIFFSNV